MIIEYNDKVYVVVKKLTNITNIVIIDAKTICKTNIIFPSNQYKKALDMEIMAFAESSTESINHPKNVKKRKKNQISKN
jgi:hypothetical protein